VTFYVNRDHDLQKSLGRARAADRSKCRSKTLPCQKVVLKLAESCQSGDRPGLPTRVSGLMLWLAMASVLAGIFDIKYYFHLQVRSVRLVRRLVGTFTFCTARAPYLGPSSSAAFHQIGKRERQKR